MFKKILIGSFALTIAAFSNSVAFAQQAVELKILSQELVSPAGFDVKTGETVNVKVINRSEADATFMVPVMDISVEVPKNHSVVVPLNFSNPPEKNVWYRINIKGGSNNRPGIFNVTDYTVKVPTSNVESIDTSVLKDIINYDTTFVYEDKPEPVYRTTPAPDYNTYEPVEKPIYTEPAPNPVEKGGYVRGYW